MLDINKKTLHASRHPSLLPLRMALTLAERESPSRPPCIDVNEQYAIQLIAKVKAQYKKQQFVLSCQDIPNPNGVHRTLHDMEIIPA